MVAKTSRRSPGAICAAWKASCRASSLAERTGRICGSGSASAGSSLRPRSQVASSAWAGAGQPWERTTAPGPPARPRQIPGDRGQQCVEALPSSSSSAARARSMAGSPSGASCKDPASSSTSQRSASQASPSMRREHREALNVPEFGVRRGRLPAASACAAAPRRRRRRCRKPARSASRVCELGSVPAVPTAARRREPVRSRLASSRR